MEEEEDPVNWFEICDNNAAASPIESCQFLKCIPKEKVDSNSISGDSPNKHAVLKRANGNNGAYGIGNFNNSSGSEDYCGFVELSANGVKENELFAYQNDDGDWILNWNVEQTHNEDFVEMCFYGEMLMIFPRYKAWIFLFFFHLNPMKISI